MNTQLTLSLYIYDVFSTKENRWVSHTVLAYDQSLADMTVWATYKNQYHLVKVVLGGDRRKRSRAIQSNKGRASTALPLHITQTIGGES